MKRLFDENEKWTDAAREVDREVMDALRPIIKRLAESGTSMIDVENVLHSASALLCSEMRIRKDIERRKLEKIEKERLKIVSGSITVPPPKMITPAEQVRAVSERKQPVADIDDDLVLVHADGGHCHGTTIKEGECQGCHSFPDTQSTEFWPRSEAR